MRAQFFMLMVLCWIILPWVTHAHSEHSSPSDLLNLSFTTYLNALPRTQEMLLAVLSRIMLHYFWPQKNCSIFVQVPASPTVSVPSTRKIVAPPSTPSLKVRTVHQVQQQSSPEKAQDPESLQIPVDSPTQPVVLAATESRVCHLGLQIFIELSELSAESDLQMQERAVRAITRWLKMPDYF